MIKIKPLSSNDAWRGGRRFNTNEYKAYIEELCYKLPPGIIPEGNLELIAEFYISNKRADLDNFLKPFIDVLQKKYQFNDKEIYKIVATKHIVNKGEEGINYEIKKHDIK